MLDHIGTGIRQIIVFCILLGVAVLCARTFLPEMWRGAVKAGSAVEQTKLDAKVDQASGAAVQQARSSCGQDIAAVSKLAAQIVATTKPQPPQPGQPRQMVSASTLEAGLPPP